MKSNLISIAWIALGCNCLQGAVLAHYGYNGNNDADSVASGLTASTATILAGGSSGLLPIEGSRSQFITNADLTNTSTPDTSDIKMTFSLSPDPGQQITLDPTNSVTWGFRSYDSDVGAMNTYTRMYIASDAAFTIILASSAVFEALHDTSGTDGDARWGPVISGNLDQSVISSGTLYFGLAGGDNSTFGDKQLRYDDVTVNGSIGAVPEPSTVLLGGLGALGLLRRRRA